MLPLGPLHTQQISHKTMSIAAGKAIVHPAVCIRLGILAQDHVSR